MIKLPPNDLKHRPHKSTRSELLLLLLLALVGVVEGENVFELLRTGTTRRKLREAGVRRACMAALGLP